LQSDHGQHSKGNWSIAQCHDFAIMGCIVNGPGEAKEVAVGLTGGTPQHLLYLNGKPHHKLTSENLVDELEKNIRAQLAKR